MRNYTIIEDDLLNANADFICHQVNCQGKMGSGVAKAIRKKYPQVYEQYKQFCGMNTVEQLLGFSQYVKVSDIVDNRPYYVVNMFAQNNYGYDRKQYTSIEAFKKCLESINSHCIGYTVAFPWMIGCVRGGADWNVVLPMILETLTDVKEIIFYKLDLG